jgi:hypothetical protein
MMTDFGPLSGSRPTGQAPTGLAGSRFDPGQVAAALHGDIKLMLLASPTDENSALMPTGLSVRETEFAMNSGAYRQVYRPARKEFGFQLTAKGRRLRAALATQSTEKQP